MELETIWSKKLNNEIAEWNKYESYSKSMFGTVIGQLHDKVLSACRQDKSRWSMIEADKDLISLIAMLEKICAQNMTGKKVFIPYANLFTIEKCLGFKQRSDTTTTEFALQVNSMYASVIHQNGKYAFGLGYYDLVLQRHSMVFKDYIALNNTEQYDNEVQELIVSMLILKGSDHGRARTELQQQYAFGTMTDDLYPTTEENVVSLLDTFAGNNNNNDDNNNNISNNDDRDAVVAAHDATQAYHSDDDGGSDNESIMSYISEKQEEAGATLLVNINESPDNESGFRAMILANAVTEYDIGISEIEDNFINRSSNIDHQDLSSAFDDNEHDALACAHVVVIDDNVDNNDDFVVVDDPNNNDNNDRYC